MTSTFFCRHAARGMRLNASVNSSNAGESTFADTSPWKPYTWFMLIVWRAHGRGIPNHVSTQRAPSFPALALVWCACGVSAYLVVSSENVEAVRQQQLEREEEHDDLDGERAAVHEVAVEQVYSKAKHTEGQSRAQHQHMDDPQRNELKSDA